MKRVEAAKRASRRRDAAGAEEQTPIKNQLKEQTSRSSEQSCHLLEKQSPAFAAVINNYSAASEEFGLVGESISRLLWVERFSFRFSLFFLHSQKSFNSKTDQFVVFVSYKNIVLKHFLLNIWEQKEQKCIKALVIHTLTQGWPQDVAFFWAVWALILKVCLAVLL